MSEKGTGHKPRCVLAIDHSLEELSHPPGLVDLGSFALDQIRKATGHAEVGISIIRAAGSAVFDLMHAVHRSTRI